MEAAQADLAAAERLLPDLVRPAAYHLQQAAEKLGKAVLAGGGLVPPRSHDLGYLASLLPLDHALRAKLAAFDDLTVYHLAGRYPIGDALAPPPGTDELLERLRRLREFQASVRSHLGR